MVNAELIESTLNRYSQGVLAHLRPAPERGALLLIIEADRVGCRWVPLCMINTWYEHPQQCEFPGVENLLNLVCEINTQTEFVVLSKIGDTVSMCVSERP